MELKYTETRTQTSLYIETVVTSTDAQFYNLCIPPITQGLHVSALSPSSRGLHQNVTKT